MKKRGNIWDTSCRVESGRCMSCLRKKKYRDGEREEGSIERNYETCDSSCD